MPNTAAGRARVSVLRQRRYDSDLALDVLSVFGYRSECSCRWKGKLRRSMAAARRDLREHLDSRHHEQGG